MAPPSKEDRQSRRRDLLKGFGASDSAVEEILARDLAPPEGASWQLPLADESHLRAWRRYALEAAELGTVEALSRRLVQLRFPVAAGISGSEAYRAATRRGICPDRPFDLRRACERPEEIHLYFARTLAGALPVLYAAAPGDFVTLFRMLTARNEPVPVPPSLGACLVSGLTNWDRVRELRRRWRKESAGKDLTWPEELQRLRRSKESYQDRLILLRDGDYSGVPAHQAGVSQDTWAILSRKIRLAHEAAHYLVLRVHGAKTSPWLGEVLADFAGLVAATGGYDEDLALRCLGLDRSGIPLAGGRLESYRGNPPLSGEAWQVVCGVARRAVAELGTWARTQAVRVSAPEAVAEKLLQLAAGTLVDLADGHGLAEMDTK